MEESEQKESNGNGQNNSSLAKFTGMGFQMIAVIGIFTFIGYKIDKAYNHTTQWATAIFSLIGVIISIYIVIKSLKD